MSEESIPNTMVYCQRCGALIGHYVEQDGLVWIQVGAVRLAAAHGVCRCGEEWHWSASQRSLGRLVERVLAIRKRDYGTIQQIVV